MCCWINYAAAALVLNCEGFTLVLPKGKIIYTLDSTRVVKYAAPTDIKVLDLKTILEVKTLSVFEYNLPSMSRNRIPCCPQDSAIQFM